MVASRLILFAALLGTPPMLLENALAQDVQTPIAATRVASDPPSGAPRLEDLLWVARPLVVFADSENDARFRQQMTLLEQTPADLSDRDVVILTDTDPTTLSPLRETLRPRDFVLVLIDKDGTVIQRRPTPTSVRELTRTIDRLPSRRLETGSRRQ